LSEYVGLYVDQRTTAQAAAHIELNVLGRGGGVQDHYASALGGLQVLAFYENGLVGNRPLALDESAQQRLDDRLRLYFTGISREANAILKTQTTEGLDEIKDQGESVLKMLESNDIDAFGESLNRHWEIKKRRSTFISTPVIDEHYEAALANGALGAKLVGAGGGGYMLCYSHDTERLDAAMTARGLMEVPFHFDPEGTRLCKL
jgi:D-glycero-alpha-D-manno-heptose-7-phosphate kinase